MKKLINKKQLSQFLGTSLVAITSIFAYGVWVSGCIEQQEIVEAIKSEREMSIFIAQSKQTKKIYTNKNVAKIKKKSLLVTSN